MQQKLADADSFAAQQQQAQQQTQQQTLALLDQSHLQQLSKLHSQLQEQCLTHQGSEAKLKEQVGQQDESVQQLQEQVRQLEQQCKELKQSCATERAVAKSLLKASASKQGAASDNSNDNKHDTSSDSMRDDSINADKANATTAADHSNSSDSAGPVATSATAMAYTTLSLEADVLRKEARILKEQLSSTEVANRVLVQTQKQDKQQHMAQLSTLRQTLDDLDEKHRAAVAMLDDTVAAITHRTGLILQQRQTGMQPLPIWAICSNNTGCLLHTEAQQLHCMNTVMYDRPTY